MKKKRKLALIVNAVMILMAVMWLLPMLWMFMASVDPSANVFTKLPSGITMQNFASVLKSHTNQMSFLNSLILSFGVAVLVIICSGLAGYALSRYEMKYKKSFLMTVLFMSSLPGTVLIVPVYRMFVTLKLNDSLAGIILFMAATTLPYSLWMMKNFMDSVPLYLEEAASVDGAGTWQRIRRIIVPLMVPGTFCVAIQAFIGAWGNFMVPFILLKSAGKYPAAVTMYQYIGMWDISYGELTAFSILYAVPVLFLYVIGQNYMSKGFSMSGAGKG
ncbi:carbohydrate ABC transporter permease [Diplocloster hominis]|uniref:carbohydrate ABC transporter permease n=1 Tax=Diplocloster hominis TaxID=3079010 RepID=UPI0031BA84F1